MQHVNDNLNLDFGGIWVPLVTPLRGGLVDHPALQHLVRHLAAQGVTGFVACGSTGEAAMLSEAEQAAVLASTLAAAGGKPVLMGLGGVQAPAIAARAQALAAEHAVAGWLLSAPAYVKPSQAGIVRHFHAVADATALPLVAYDVPARTGVAMQPATLRALAEHPRIRALKDCSGSRAQAQAVLDDGRLALLAGNDDELLDQLARGAVGAISASAQLAPAAFVQLHQWMQAGQLPAARHLWATLAPLVDAAFAEPNPAALKAALARLGWLADELRLPMLPARVQTADAVLSALQRVNSALNRR